MWEGCSAGAFILWNGASWILSGNGQSKKSALAGIVPKRKPKTRICPGLVFVLLSNTLLIPIEEAPDAFVDFYLMMPPQRMEL